MPGPFPHAPAGLLGVLAALILACPATALALPPENDYPAGAAPFTPITAEDGQPRDQQAIGELAEATPEPGTLQCLGPTSFARTVWFRVPATEAPQQMTVEATGRTLAVVE